MLISIFGDVIYSCVSFCSCETLSYCLNIALGWKIQLTVPALQAVCDTNIALTDNVMTILLHCAALFIVVVSLLPITAAVLWYTTLQSLFTSSSSFCVSSSIRRMSSIVRSTHLSIEQNSCLWKCVNKRFSTWTQWGRKDWAHNTETHTDKQKAEFCTVKIWFSSSVPSVCSFPSCSVAPSIWTQQWRAYRHTCVDSWGSEPVLSANTVTHLEFKFM